jgi:hypothetical protein
MKYDIRKGHYASIEGDKLKEVMSSIFGDVKLEGVKLVSSYGAIIRLEVQVLSRTAMDIASTTDKTVSLDVQTETIKRWNKFLEQATGFTSKERSKRLQKKAKEGNL